MQAKKVVLVSYARQVLQEGTRERERMKLYADSVEELHVVVLTNKGENFPTVQREGDLYLHATSSVLNLSKVFTAVKIVRRILSSRQTETKWLVSSQDPFETALVSQLATWRKNAVRQIQIHGDVFNPASARTSLLQRLRVRYAKYVLLRTDCVRVVSERIKKSLVKQGVNEAKITVLPIAADLAKFIKAGQERGGRNEVSSFLYVGRFSPEKNVNQIIKSFCHIAGDYPQASLTLLGDGPLRKNIEKQVERSGFSDQINIMNWTTRVEEVMSCHDVLCLASSHEGWGMVLLEAAASRLPVITTDVGCVGEYIESEVHGIVVSTNDIESISRAMERYIENPDLAREHGRAGYELVRSANLNEETYLNKMVECWSSCL